MPSPTRRLRLMTWNVRSLRDDRAAVVRVIKRSAPDVLFVQEAPRLFRARSKLAALARESGLVVACGGKPAAGVAILTTMRVDVERVSEHLLSKTEGLHQRGLAVAECVLSGRRFVAASLHLGLKPEERERHATEIERSVSAAALPTVLAGDFNETADGPAWQRLANGHRDIDAEQASLTFPSKAPRRRIDAILVPSDWDVSVVSPHEIVDESDLIAATDHRPVIADVVG